MIRIWIVLLVVEIHLSLLRESCFLLASFWNPDCLHLELTQKSKKFFDPRDVKFSKNLSCFTSHPKYNGLLGEILFSSFLTCSIISFHLFIITSNDQKYEFESNELFFRSLAAITFGNILSWSNQDLDLYPTQSAQSTNFSVTYWVHGIFPRFRIHHEEIFLNHTHYKDAQIIKIKILVLIHLI